MEPPASRPWPSHIEILRVLRETGRARVYEVSLDDARQRAILKIGAAVPRIDDAGLAELAPLLWGAHAVTDLVGHEAQVLETLAGMGVPHVLGYRQTPGSSALLTSLAPGTPATHLPLQLRRAHLVDLTRSVADTLARAHRRSIVHRDLKPEHVIVSIDGALSTTLVDWEMAQLAQRRVYGGVGTSAFHGWEMCRLRRHIDEEVGPSVDVFALGLVLWALATDVLPQLRWRGAVDPVIDDLHEQWPDAPPDLVELIAAMTCADPGRRPTCEEILALLDLRSEAGGDARPLIDDAQVDSKRRFSAPPTVDRARRAAQSLNHAPVDRESIWDLDPELWLDLDLPALAPDLPTPTTALRPALWLEALRLSGRAPRAITAQLALDDDSVVERIASYLDLSLFDVALTERRALLARSQVAGRRAMRLVLDRLLTSFWSGKGRDDLIALCAAHLLAHERTYSLVLARLIRVATRHATEPDVLAARVIALEALADELAIEVTLSAVAAAGGLPVVERHLPWLPPHLPMEEMRDWAWLELGHVDRVTSCDRPREWHHRLRLSAVVEPEVVPMVLASIRSAPSSYCRSFGDSRECARLETLAALRRGGSARWPGGEDAHDEWLAALCARADGALERARDYAHASAKREPRRDVYWRTLAEIEARLGHAEGCVRALARLRWPEPDDWSILELGLRNVVVPLTHEPSWETIIDALAPFDLQKAAQLASELAQMSMQPGRWITRQLMWLLACGDVGRARSVARGAHGLDAGEARHWQSLLAEDGGSTPIRPQAPRRRVHRDA